MRHPLRSLCYSRTMRLALGIHFGILCACQRGTVEVHPDEAYFFAPIEIGGATTCLRFRNRGGSAAGCGDVCTLTTLPQAELTYWDAVFESDGTSSIGLLVHHRNERAFVVGVEVETVCVEAVDTFEQNTNNLLVRALVVTPGSECLVGAGFDASLGPLEFRWPTADGGYAIVRTSAGCSQLVHVFDDMSTCLTQAALNTSVPSAFLRGLPHVILDQTDAEGSGGRPATCEGFACVQYVSSPERQVIAPTQFVPCSR